MPISPASRVGSGGSAQHCLCRCNITLDFHPPPLSIYNDCALVTDGKGFICHGRTCTRTHKMQKERHDNGQHRWHYRAVTLTYRQYRPGARRLRFSLECQSASACRCSPNRGRNVSYAFTYWQHHELLQRASDIQDHAWTVSLLPWGGTHHTNTNSSRVHSKICTCRLLLTTLYRELTTFSKILLGMKLPLQHHKCTAGYVVYFERAKLIKVPKKKSLKHTLHQTT